jgi:hypothetical protein
MRRLGDRLGRIHYNLMNHPTSSAVDTDRLQPHRLNHPTSSAVHTQRLRRISRRSAIARDRPPCRT